MQSEEQRTCSSGRIPPKLSGKDRERFIAREELNDLKRMFFLMMLPSMLKKWKVNGFVASKEEVKIIFFAFQQIIIKQIEVDKIDLQFNFENRERPDDFFHLLAVNLTCWAYGDFQAEETEIQGLFDAWDKLDSGRPSWDLITPYKEPPQAITV